VRSGAGRPARFAVTEAPTAPDLRAVTAAFRAAEARFVVIGGFAVIAYRHVPATEDVAVLVPDAPANEACCLRACDRLDLEALTEEHGELPRLPLPGVDVPSEPAG
jgi:hypothetical protein